MPPYRRSRSLWCLSATEEDTADEDYKDVVQEIILGSSMMPDWKTGLNDRLHALLGSGNQNTTPRSYLLVAFSVLADLVIASATLYV